MDSSALTAPVVLAGPLIASLTPDSVIFWIASSIAVTPQAVKAEVWDPLPDGINGYIADPTPQTGILAGFQSASDLRSLKIADSLWISLVTVRSPMDGWPRQRALAYRIAVDASSWLTPPGGAEPLPGAPPAAPPRGQPPSPSTVGNFPYAWFTFDSLGEDWTILHLHGGSPSTWNVAEAYLARLSRGPARVTAPPNGLKPNVPAGRPSLAILLAFGASEVDPSYQGWTARNWLWGVPSALANELARGLLMLSPSLWAALASEGVSGILPLGPSEDGVRPVAAADAAALARIGAHLPIFAQLVEPPRSDVTPDVAQLALALLFNWGNCGASAPPAGVFTELRASGDLAPACPPSPVLVGAWPGRIERPRAPSRPEPYLIVAGETPLIAAADQLGQLRDDQLGNWENLIVLSVGTSASLMVPKSQLDAKDFSDYSRSEHSQIGRDSKSGTGLPAHRIYQLLICAGASKAKPPSLTHKGIARQWNSRTLSYGDSSGSVLMTAAVPTFAVISSEGSTRPGVRMTLFTDVDHGIATALVHLGHRVVPKSDEIWLGNRMRLEDPTDGHNLGGIDVLIDNSRRGTTNRDGLVPGLLASLTPGSHTLSIGGRLVQDGNAGPATASNGPRLWRKRDFQIQVVQEQSVRRIVSVDDEPVISGGVQILVDPVWMNLVSGKSHTTPHRHLPLSLIVVHRTESWDGRHTLTTWQTTEAQRIHEGEDPKQANTAAAYLLARDGTLVKGAADNEVVNHAPGAWGPRTGNPPRAPDSQQIGVGIEMSKQHDETGPYTDAQYAHLVWLIGQYVKHAGVRPSDVVGHGDVKDVGKDDPGLEFEWSRIEKLGFGIRRALASEGGKNPLVSPIPEFPATVDFSNSAAQAKRFATAEFQRSMAEDLALYPTLFAAEIAGKSPSAALAAVKVKAINLIEGLGYSQLSADQEKHSFMSHIFSGARRTYFALKRHQPGEAERVIDEERDNGFDQDSPLTVIERDKLAAVYAKLFTDSATVANPFDPAEPPEPPAPR